MNEKNNFIFDIIFYCLFLFTLSSCCTGKGLYYNNSRTGEIRNNIGKLADTEAKAVERSESLNWQIRGSLEGLRRLEELIEAGDGDIDEFKKIIQRIRERSSEENK